MSSPACRSAGGQAQARGQRPGGRLGKGAHGTAHAAAGRSSVPPQGDGPHLQPAAPRLAGPAAATATRRRWRQDARGRGGSRTCSPQSRADSIAPSCVSTTDAGVTMPASPPSVATASAAGSEVRRGSACSYSPQPERKYTCSNEARYKRNRQAGGQEWAPVGAHAPSVVAVKRLDVPASCVARGARRWRALALPIALGKRQVANSRTQPARTRDVQADSARRCKHATGLGGHAPRHQPRPVPPPPPYEPASAPCCTHRVRALPARELGAHVGVKAGVEDGPALCVRRHDGQDGRQHAVYFLGRRAHNLGARRHLGRRGGWGRGKGMRV